MKSLHSVLRRIPIAMSILLFCCSVSQGEVIGITGSSATTVIQFDGILPVQSDFSNVIIPLTKAEPPAISIAQVERFDDEKMTASGAGLALFEEPNLAAGGIPNDVGMDLAAFAEDDTTSWFLRGEASETRTIIIGAADAGSDMLSFGGVNRGRSRVILSGVMFVTSQDSTRDLTGAEVKLQVRVERRQFNNQPAEVVNGEVVLSGGPNGSVTVSRADGSFSGAFLPVIDFTDAVPELPLVQALLFAGHELAFEYDFDVGVPFELQLTVVSEIRTIPGGVGASAVFGLPQTNLSEVMLKVAKDDRGARLSAAIADRVDTTGAAYQNNSPGFLFPSLCGATGAEMAAAAFFFLGMIGLRTGRRCRSAPQH
jgi:hypothetical protein